MKCKLLCIDIDGTLVDDNKKVPEAVKESLKKASDAGIRIALASGRMPAGVELIEKELGIECIKICNAGTYTLMGDACIDARYLTVDAMVAVYREAAAKNHVPLWIFQGKEWYVTDIDKYVEREIRIIPHTPKLADLETLAEAWRREKSSPNKLLIAADPDKIPLIYKDMKAQGWQDIDLACSADIFIEIFPMGASKGRALKAICSHLRIGLEEVIAFGDQELDISMIETAGMGIAMGNAIQELKEKADFVTKTNNEAGVAYALERFLA